MSAEIKNAQSKELLAVIEDSEELGNEFYLEENNRATVSREFRLAYSRWLNNLKTVITEL